MRGVINLEEGWNIIENFIARLKNMMEGLPGERVSPQELADLYTLVFNMCNQLPYVRFVREKQLYDRYVEVFLEYINSKVLPALQAKHGEDMLKEFVKRYDNHKIMVRWLSFVFQYLDRFFMTREEIQTPLKVVGAMFFLNLVYVEMKVDVKDAVIALINRDREGAQINRQLVKKVIGIFVEIGMEAYETDFEMFVLEDTVAYYRKKASTWTSRSIYITKTQECLDWEKDRVDHYLHASSELKLLEKVQEELLSHCKKLHVRCVLG